MMKLPLMVGLGVTLCSFHASASEPAFLRSLQDGPLGNSPSFARIYGTELEIGYQGTRRTGSAESDTNELSGTIDHQELGAAFGYRVNRDLKFMTTLSTGVSQYDLNADNFSFAANRRRIDIGAGPTFAVNNLVFGGSVRGTYLDEESSRTTLANRSIQHELPAAFLPSMRVFGGIYASEFRFVLGLKTFARERVNKLITNSDGTSYSVKRNRSEPGEIWMDGMVQASERVRLGFSGTIETLRQQGRSASEDFEGIRNADGIPIFVDEGQNRNRFSIGLGGTYTANEKLELSSSIQSIHSAFDAPEYASLLAENLGGYQINVGSILDASGLLLKFSAGYMIPTAERFEVTDSRVTPWAKVGETVRIEQPLWKLGLHASVPL